MRVVNSKKYYPQHQGLVRELKNGEKRRDLRRREVRFYFFGGFWKKEGRDLE
jgi:hypothetical protein